MPLHADHRLSLRSVPRRPTRASHGVCRSRRRNGQLVALLGFPALYAAVGLTAAFLALPVAAAVLTVVVAFGLRSARPAARAGPASIRGLARERDFWLLLVGVAFAGMLAQTTVLSWMPTYLRQVHGFGVVSAGLSTGIVVTGLTLFSPSSASSPTA